MMKTGDLRRAFTYLESGAVLLVTTNDGTHDILLNEPEIWANQNIF